LVKGKRRRLSEVPTQPREQDTFVSKKQECRSTEGVEKKKKGGREKGLEVVIKGHEYTILSGQEE